MRAAIKDRARALYSPLPGAASLGGGFSFGGKMKTHPAAESFPMMDDKRFAELVEDINTHGQLEPITVCEDMILDGRNRHRACVELGLKPKLREFAGEDPWLYVWSLNGERRDLVAEQRYLIWKHCHEESKSFQAKKRRIKAEESTKKSETAKIKARGSGGAFEPQVDQPDQPVVKQPKQAKTRQAKAAATKTSPAAVARGDRLVKERPDLASAVRRGEIKPAEAHRQMKKDEVRETVAALPADKFAVIYADPPWKYGDQRHGDTIGATGAEHHYPTMSLSELKSLSVDEMAADNCVLFLWATCPLLEDALELCRAWGFRYKAQFIWDKVKHNMGHYNSVRHEILLVCTKGSATPQNVKLYDSVQEIEKTRRHSEKPEEFRAIIDDLYPTGNRIELFRRGGAPSGWSAWGNEVRGE